MEGFNWEASQEGHAKEVPAVVKGEEEISQLTVRGCPSSRRACVPKSPGRGL